MPSQLYKINAEMKISEWARHQLIVKQSCLAWIYLEFIFHILNHSNCWAKLMSAGGLLLHTAICWFPPMQNIVSGLRCALKTTIYWTFLETPENNPRLSDNMAIVSCRIAVMCFPVLYFTPTDTQHNGSQTLRQLNGGGNKNWGIIILQDLVKV